MRTVVELMEVTASSLTDSNRPAINVVHLDLYNYELKLCTCTRNSYLAPSLMLVHFHHLITERD